MPQGHNITVIWHKTAVRAQAKSLYNTKDIRRVEMM